MPLVRQHLPGRSRPGASRLGSGRRADGRGCVPGASVPGDGRRRRRLALRAESGARRCVAGTAGRARRLLLHARRRGRGAGDALRPARGRLVRCPWRPEHAGELSQRKPLGHAVSDAARLRQRPPGGRGAGRRPQPRSPRGSSSSRRAAFALEWTSSKGLSMAPMPSTSPSTRTCSIPRTRSSASCPSRAASPSSRLLLLLRRIAADRAVAGIGITGLGPAPENVAPVARLAAAAGL